MKPLLLLSLVLSAADDRVDSAAVVKAVDAPRGLCVILGDPEGNLAIKLARDSELMIYVQDPDAKHVDGIRTRAADNSFLGSRIFVHRGALSRLHLADSLADVIVVQGEAVKAVPEKELLRVLRPDGKILGLGRELSKKLPDGTDEWTHPYHGPDNNPQSRDRAARAPYLTHFTAEPWYSPMPLVTVASGGRLFKAMGHLSVKEREWPWLNTLIAQNAYNGSLLWKRPLEEGFMIHRNTLIATPTVLYLGDNKSCKVIDAATGKQKDEIVVPKDIGDGPSWKWMALVDNVLYAMIGKEEPPDPTLKGNRLARGWPWRGGALGQGYDSKTYPWGFGNTIIAIDPSTKKVLWKHQEKERLDSRAMCMADGRIVFYSHGNFLGCLNAKSGKVEWRTTDAEVMKAVGEHKFAQNPGEGFSTTCFTKCNDRAIYFAGPTRTDLAAVSIKDGKLLWTAKDRGNSQLVLREDGLYAMSPKESTCFDFMTGKPLGVIGPRVNCTRATGSIDSIFVRGGRDGTIRYDLGGNKQQHLCPMRPSCQDGVVVSYGHLYWGPWMCDCNLTLVGVLALEPAGSFDFDPKVEDKERLESSEIDRVAEFPVGDNDWPTLRANNQRSSYVPVNITKKPVLKWSYSRKGGQPATAPVVAGGTIFFGSATGQVRAIDAATGGNRWEFLTGGAITYPPALWKDRLYVGSADGWVYALEAKTGRQLWRFRAAPAERIIPVYGSLRSTWPVASGVLVDDGVVYAAAGMANHDGTHVYALDAITGKHRWHNGTSGSLHPTTSGGVSVNGHLLLHKKQLHLAGGNVVAVASYDIASGKCLTDPSAPQSHTQFRAGSDLYVQNDQVQISGQPIYTSRGDYRMVSQAALQTPVGEVVAMMGIHNATIGLMEPGAKADAKPLWKQSPVSRIHAIAVTRDAIVITGGHDPAKKDDRTTYSVQALSLKDGEPLWKHSLDAAPTLWGAAVDREGRVIVTLEDGRVLAFVAK
jgi:outer membrane protein assembly factor BamB